MKRKLCQRIFILVLSLTIIFSNIQVIYAQDSIDQLLLDANFPQEIIDTMDNVCKEKLVLQYLSNKENYKASNSYLEIDNLEEINYIANMSDEDFENSNLSADEILLCKKQVRELRTSSKENIMSTYNVDSYAAKLIKAAADTPRNSKAKTNDVKASGSISTSKLTISMGYAMELSSEYPDYLLMVLFSWSSPPFVNFDDDAVAVAWGGNLVLEEKESLISYKSVNAFVTSYTKKASSSKENVARYSEIDINTGGAFYFPSYDASMHMFDRYNNRIKSGRIEFRLYQTEKKGNTTTKVIANYCHKALGFGDISVSYPPSISVTFGYDISDSQASQIIKY